MTDELRPFLMDDPNDAPERRLSVFPTINPFIPTSLPQYVIPPVANSLYTAMQYYWYSAYQQGIAAQKQQQHQQHQLLQQQHQHQLMHQQPKLDPIHSNAHHHHNHHHHPHLHNPHQAAPSPSSSVIAPLSASSSASSSSASPSSSSTQSAGGSSASATVTSTTPANNHHQHLLHHHSLSSNDGSNHSTSINNSTTTTATNDNNSNTNQHHHHRSEERDQQQRHYQHIKKPLNAFMIYMRKRRPDVVKQGSIKESAAINQMLGQQWRKLSKEEQAPYYKLAEQEKLLHAQKYPGWSARDNYANQKKKKKMKLKSISLNGLDQSDKKCRARFGLSNMSSWCKPCRRKKKCIYNRPSAQTNHHHHNHLNDCHHHQLAID